MYRHGPSISPEDIPRHRAVYVCSLRHRSLSLIHFEVCGLCDSECKFSGLILLGGLVGSFSLVSISSARCRDLLRKVVVFSIETYLGLFKPVGLNREISFTCLDTLLSAHFPKKHLLKQQRQQQTAKQHSFHQPNHAKDPPQSSSYNTPYPHSRPVRHVSVR